MSDIKVDLRKFAEKRADEVIKVDLSNFLNHFNFKLIIKINLLLRFLINCK